MVQTACSWFLNNNIRTTSALTNHNLYSERTHDGCAFIFMTVVMKDGTGLAESWLTYLTPHTSEDKWHEVCYCESQTVISYLCPLAQTLCGPFSWPDSGSFSKHWTITTEDLGESQTGWKMLKPLLLTQAALWEKTSEVISQGTLNWLWASESDFHMFLAAIIRLMS